jgi:hypothetical protein
MSNPEPNFESWDRNDYTAGEQCNYHNGKLDDPVEFAGYIDHPRILEHPKHGPQLKRCIGLVGQWIDIIDAGAVVVYFKEIDEAVVMNVRWLWNLRVKK